ncbi:hypothetical protein GCM10027037_00660 [Mucilaginibacter koreensis]
MTTSNDRLLRCFILEDEKHQVDHLAGFIDQTIGLTFAGSSANALTALSDVTGPGGPDLVFLSTYVHGMNGIDFAQAVKGHTKIIFISSMPWRIQEIFPDEAFEYLPKPISYEAFLKCIGRIRKRKY